MRATTLLFVLFVASAAHAEPTASDRETARALMNDGDRLFKQGDPRGALKSYEAADAIMRVPSTGVEVAKAHEALGELIEARDTCLRVLRAPSDKNEPKAFVAARERCDTLAKSVEPKIGSIQLDGVDASVTVTIDGAAWPKQALQLPRRVNPGKHVLVASASGKKDLRVEVEVAPGAKATQAIALEPDGAEKPIEKPIDKPIDKPLDVPKEPVHDAGRGPIPAWGFVGFGVGIVGVGLGAVMGGLAFAKTSDAKAFCVNDLCSPAAAGSIDDAKTFGHVSEVALIVGGVGLAVGVVAILARPRAARSAIAPRGIIVSF